MLTTDFITKYFKQSDKMSGKHKEPLSSKTETHIDSRPGDAYNEWSGAINEVKQLMSNNGWKINSSNKNNEYWTRPGKKNGASASFGYTCPNGLYVFSTSIPHFQANTNYLPFQILAKLKYDGNYALCARELKVRGFGEHNNTKKADPPLNEKGNEPEDDMPFIPEWVYQKLPSLLKKPIKEFEDDRERDVFLVSALTVISGTLQNVEGRYFNSIVYPNLYVFISAPASAGKSAMAWAKYYGLPIHREFREQTKNAKEEYELEMEQYNTAKKNEKPPKPQPPVNKLLFIPANISSTGMLKALTDNNESGIMLETEADTLSGALTQDWGNFSDALRKAFHHEGISYLRRKDEEYVEMEKPRLSIALSGTPEQVKTLIGNVENGLFSRFMFYTYRGIQDWRNPFKFQQHSKEEYFEKLGEEFCQLVKLLDNNNQTIQVKLTRDQEKHFNMTFEKWQNDLLEIAGEDTMPSVKRLGLITYRILMVLVALRIEDQGEIDQVLYPGNDDFEVAFAIVEVLKKHAVHMINNLPNKKSEDINLKHKQFMNNLPEKFTRKEGLKIAMENEISRATYDRLLTKRGFIKMDQGIYKKPVKNKIN